MFSTSQGKTTVYVGGAFRKSQFLGKILRKLIDEDFDFSIMQVEITDLTETEILKEQAKKE